MSEERLLKEAKELRENAYCPYSEYSVGVILTTRDGRKFKGVNVETCTYTGSIHGEKAAVINAVKEGYGVDDFKKLVIHSDSKNPPCGICRQFLSEFVENKKLKIITRPSKNEEKEYNSYWLKDLLSENLDSKNVKNQKD